MTQTETSPDARIKNDVLAELRWAPGVDATHIGVGVTDGAITLSGEVESFPERHLAEKAVRRVKGVRAIAEQITVRDVGANAVANDTDIAREAGAALERAVDIARGAVSATVRNHVITLSGTVPWHYQREAAVRSVRHLRGVRDVVNELHVKAPVPTGNIRKGIEAALVRHAVLDAQRCTVTADGGAVTIEGEVGTWAERTAVDRVAWAAPGVTMVHNRLRVTD